MNPYATHLPLLLRAVALTTGPVLEVGSGWNSTPLLRGLCHDRPLVTVENDPQWAGHFPPTNPLHTLRVVRSFDEVAGLCEDWWDVVLIDHDPQARRPVEVDRLRDNCTFLVLHDTEHERLQRTMEEFRYVYQSRRLFPFATVGSNVCSVDCFHDL